MNFNLIIWGSKEYEEMVELRHNILRKPLGLHYSEDYLAEEKNDILIGAYKKDQLLGCCILRIVSDEVVQLKQMAVAVEAQYTGIGSQIISFAEETARNIGHGRIFMHARKIAVTFYQKLGYQIRGEEFEEVGLPHVLMTKELL
ncbi:GNAT family N-acetyltransferase [Desertivirga arenae]|uniref:GNAT family N-acetyltransferase n=1 Tax=Desertivirga arenae TaxID=2810309 RepID=UPI001A97458C|nr:GNAT family N-acetyltransferase [Pedobacter sp. SYSU D00823]